MSRTKDLFNQFISIQSIARFLTRPVIQARLQSMKGHPNKEMITIKAICDRKEAPSGEHTGLLYRKQATVELRSLN